MERGLRQLPPVPRYIEEGKSYLTISVGCTGGKHPSVVVANDLGAALRARVGTSPCRIATFSSQSKPARIPAAEVRAG